MKKFKGTAICLCNVGVGAMAESEKMAKRRLLEVIKINLNRGLSIANAPKNMTSISITDCLEVSDVTAVKE